MQDHNARIVWRLAAFSVIVTAIGTVGFDAYGHLTPGDAFYETLVILLDRPESVPLTGAATRTLSIFLTLASLGLIAYLLKWLAEYMMGISDNVRKLRVKAKVEKLKDHYIICGLGRVGAQVAAEMHNEGVPFVGVDRDPVKVNDAVAKGYTALSLDSTTEDALQQVGVERASGLVACFGEDSFNLFVTLAARSLNPQLYIVARANRPENELKLKRAGANRGAMPV